MWRVCRKLRGQYQSPGAKGSSVGRETKQSRVRWTCLVQSLGGSRSMGPTLVCVWQSVRKQPRSNQGMSHFPEGIPGLNSTAPFCVLLSLAAKRPAAS